MLNYKYANVLAQIENLNPFRGDQVPEGAPKNPESTHSFIPRIQPLYSDPMPHSPDESSFIMRNLPYITGLAGVGAGLGLNYYLSDDTPTPMSWIESGGIGGLLGLSAGKIYKDLHALAPSLPQDKPQETKPKTISDPAEDKTATLLLIASYLR